MSNKLDKSKPYGHIVNDSEGRVFEQDGRYFTGEGKPWRDPSKKETAAEREAREKAEKEEADRIAAEEEAQRKLAAGEGGNDGQLSKQLSTGSTGGAA